MQPNRELTTFRIPVQATKIAYARWPQEFLELYRKAHQDGKGFVVLGQGANVLFTSDFDGYIAVNQYKGIKVQVSPEAYYLEVHSGVTINELIDYTHRFKIWGLENLSSIPSSVGTAVVGNIGAYGVEFCQFVEQVTVLNLETGETFTLNNADCKFAYRQSVFKHELNGHYIVLSVRLRLSRKYKPVLTYAPLDKLPADVDAKTVRALVDQTRAQKLPDYEKFGNGGSFFMNPVVSLEDFARVEQIWQAQHQQENQSSNNASSNQAPTQPTGQQNPLPKIPHWAVNEAGLAKVKLSAGWLIEQTGLKGFSLGKAQVSPQHALVLGNPGEATGADISALAKHVQQAVQTKWGVTLVPEIRFMGTQGEVLPLEIWQD